MAKQFSNENHRLLYSRASEIVAERRKADGGLWLHSSGRLFKLATVFYYIFSVVNMLIYMAYLLARVLYYSDNIIYADSSSATVSELKNSIFLTVVTLAALITSIVLLKLKKYVAMGICALICSLPMLPHFYLAMSNNTTVWSFVLRHLLPISAMLVCGVYLMVTALLDRREIYRQYNKIINAIYESHRDSDRLTTDEEWNRSISEYIEQPYTGKLKRSQKHRLRKQAAMQSIAADAYEPDEDYGDEPDGDTYSEPNNEPKDDENDCQ